MGEEAYQQRGFAWKKVERTLRWEVLKWESEQVRESALSKWMRNRRAEVSKVTWKLTAFGLSGWGEGVGGCFV